MSLTLERIIDAIAEALGPAVPTFRGGAGEASRLRAPRRFVWCRYDVDDQRTVSPLGLGTARGKCEVLGVDVWTCEVQCHGPSLQVVEELRAALLTAARRALQGGALGIDSCEIHPPEAANAGWVALQRVRIQRPLVAAKLPLAYADQRFPTATIEHVAADPSAPAPGALDVPDPA